MLGSARSMRKRPIGHRCLCLGINTSDDRLGYSDNT